LAFSFPIYFNFISETEKSFHNLCGVTVNF
jgi:hypothetical protein